MLKRKTVLIGLSFLVSVLFLTEKTASQEASVNHRDYYNGGILSKSMEENSPFSGLKWNSVGPVFQGGRVETVKCPIDQPGIIYAGFGSGSLWKTTNQGIDWECIFENEFSNSIGDLAISTSNPDVLYLGTGENLRASRGFTLTGTGIYKSKDAGQTWFNMGLIETHHISRIVIDPQDHNIVFVAAIGPFWSKGGQRGVYMTKDGGQSWENILYISDSTGVSDIAWDSRNKILYAAAWDMVSGEGSSLYRTDNMGYKWDKISNGIPQNNKIGRIGLAVSPSRPEIVYALVDNRNKSELSDFVLGAELYRSEDFGKTWNKTHQTELDNYSGFGWAFGDVRVSPFDHNDVYILGVYLLNSKNGGKSFERINGTIHHLNKNPGQKLHLDQHDLYIDPLHPDYLVLGNDGGVFISYDRGKSWTHCNTLPTGEFYDVSVVDGDTVRVYGGTQDNSSIMGKIIPENPDYSLDKWEYVWLDPWSGGDGFTTMEMPGDPNSVLYESQNGYLSIKNMQTGITKHIKPKPDSDENPLRNSWFTPYFISQHDHQSIYYGANKVYKTFDYGNSWIRLSPDLCYSNDESKKSRSITAIAESPLMQGLLFAGTENGIVWVSRNDGSKWFEISDGIPREKILKIVPSMHNSSRVYLVSKGMDNDVYKPNIFISENLGKNWKRISSLLPNENVNCLLEDPVLEDLIYAGTDRSIYCSQDNGNTWQSMGKNLPTTSVHQLKFIGGNKYILAATHGMSMYMAYTEPIRTYYANSMSDNPFFMNAIDGKLPLQKDFSGDWDLKSTQDIKLSFYWPERENVKISLINEAKELVYSEEVIAGKGINQWVWDLIIDIKDDKSLYPVPAIDYPDTGYYKITISSSSGKEVHGPVQIIR